MFTTLLQSRFFSNGAAAKGRCSTTLAVESLEDRLLPSITLGSFDCGKANLYVNGTPNSDRIVIRSTGTGGVQVSLNGQTRAFNPGTILAVYVNTGAGDDTVNVDKTLLGVAVTVREGDGRDVVNVSDAAHNLHTILGTLTVYGGTGHDVLNINDEANTSDTSYTLNASHLLSRYSAPIGFANIDQIHINGGSGQNTYNVLCTENGFTTSVRTGGGNDRVNIDATGYDSTLNVDGQGGPVAVNIGHNGVVHDIRGTVNLENPRWYNAIAVDDSADLIARHAALQSFTPSWDSASLWGSLTGLAPAAINSEYADTSSLALLTNSASTVDVLTTAGVPSSINGRQV